MSPHHIPTILLALALLPAPLSAQRAARCRAPTFSQFDFWLGDWTVTNPDGSTAGRSRVESIMDGCAIREAWTSEQVRGTSVSIYHAPDEAWVQTWVDNRGALLVVRGGWDGERMVLSGERRGGDGRVRHLRITWTPVEGGGVVQRQEVSEDGGETWAVAFEGTYEPGG